MGETEAAACLLMTFQRLGRQGRQGMRHDAQPCDQLVAARLDEGACDRVADKVGRYPDFMEIVGDKDPGFWRLGGLPGPITDAIGIGPAGRWMGQEGDDRLGRIGMDQPYAAVTALIRRLRPLGILSQYLAKGRPQVVLGHVVTGLTQGAHRQTPSLANPQGFVEQATDDQGAATYIGGRVGLRPVAGAQGRQLP